MQLSALSSALRRFPSPPLSLAACVMVLLSVSPAWSWGPLGHRVIVRIAQQEVAERARSRLSFYLGKDVAWEDTAMWADHIQAERPQTAAWHFIRIPPNAMELKLERDCAKGECITAKLREFEGIARLGIRDRDEIEEAIKFLIHLVGDLHQPLHEGYAEDHSGKSIPVVLAGREMSLFDAWDTALVERLGTDDAAIAQRLAQDITSEQRREWRHGYLRDWTWESHLLAARVAYGALPSGSPKRLGEEYVTPATRVIEEQLAKAGVRLAAILERVWP